MLVYLICEIISLNKNYQNKVRNILDNKKKIINFDRNIKYVEKWQSNNEKESFKIHERHKNMIDEFIKYHTDIEFSLILK